MIGPPCQGTGSWLAQTEQYMAWWRGDHRFLWIKGKAGSGKSTLMKHLLQNLRQNPVSPPLTVAAFFYHATGHEVERSTSGLLRAILYQIFTQNQSLLEDFISISDGRFLKGQNLQWEVAELMEALRMAGELESWTTAIFLLDGLDEGSREEIRQLLPFFEQLCREDLKKSHVKLKVCFSSRHYPNITINDCPEIHVERYNYQDIKTFTDQKLLRLPDTSSNNHLVQFVLDRADGVFLWVDLVTNTILMAEDDGETFDRKMERLKATPLELDDLYMQIFTRLTEVERAETFRLLKWVLFSLNSLTPLELCFAFHFEENGSYATFESWRLSGHFVESGPQMDRFIRSRSRGLVTIQSAPFLPKSTRGVVQFIHQTVPEFLLRKGFALLHPSIDFSSTLGLCHHQMALCCAEYFSQAEVFQCGSMTLLAFEANRSGHAFLDWAIPRPTVQTATRVRDSLLSHHNSRTNVPYTRAEVTAKMNVLDAAVELVFSELPLLKYSLQAFEYHINYAERFRIPQTSIVEVFLHKGPRFLRLWYSFQDALYLPRNHHFHRANWDDFLQGAVVLGLTSCIHELGIRLSNQSLRALPSSCDPVKALFIAVHQRSSAAVGHLVACGADTNARAANGQGDDCPLDIACREQDTQTVRELIQHGAMVNVQNLFGYTPFHHAAAAGALEVVQILLESGATANATLFRSKETPLQLAVINDHLDVVKLLMAINADKHARDANNNDWVALALRHRSAAVYAFLCPQSPTLPAREFGRPSLTRGFPSIDRATTASPSPERQEEKRRVRSTGFELNLAPHRGHQAGGAGYLRPDRFGNWNEGSRRTRSLES